MYTFLFLLVIIGLLIFPLVDALHWRKTAKAGKVQKFCLKYIPNFEAQPSYIKINEKIIDVRSMIMLYVHGNSMQDYGIHNGEHVLSLPYKTENEKMNIDKNSVLVFKIYKSGWQSDYKLRKFIDYVDLQNIDWDKIYTNCHENIKLPKDRFIQHCKEKYDRIKSEEKKLKYILSETYNEEEHIYEYSLHSLPSLYAKVKYTIN